MPIVTECPACGCSEHTIVAQPDSEAAERFLTLSTVKYGGLMDPWLSEIGLVIARCTSCGHHFYRNQPSLEQLHSMYEASRPLTTRQEGPTIVETNVQIHLRRLFSLASKMGFTKPTLLDYGSGMGKWAQTASKTGFKVTAYEPSFNRSRSGVSGFEIENDVQRLEGRTFDVINLEQVLEHVADPLSVVLSLRRYCKAHTILRFTVPNMARVSHDSALWQQWPFNGQSMHIMAPFEHLHGFTTKSLGKLMHRAGYTPINSLSVWRTHPIYSLRRLVGTFHPILSQTMALVQPSPQPN